MKIGVDFDNTIVNYTGVFYEVGRSLSWLPKNTGVEKAAVKQYLIEHDSEARWTELQGLVYGQEIKRATPYANALRVMQRLKVLGHKLYLISHKTKSPVIGKKKDLHMAAFNWLARHGFVSKRDSPFEVSDIFFNETQDQKIDKIASLGCAIFIDDLISVLSHKNFPKKCRGILFSPHSDCKYPDVIHDWEMLGKLLWCQER